MCTPVTAGYTVTVQAASLLVIPFAVAVTDTVDLPWATPITVAGLALCVRVMYVSAASSMLHEYVYVPEGSTVALSSLLPPTHTPDVEGTVTFGRTVSVIVSEAVPVASVNGAVIVV